MRSTMRDVPLTITSILRHGTTRHGDSEVVTATESGLRRIGYARLGARAAKLANGLRRLGVRGDERVATFGWNNQEHLEAYLAVPAMGAVLHPLDIQLTPEQAGSISGHAEDRIVIVDASLAEGFAKILPELTTVHTVLVTGTGDAPALDGLGKQVIPYERVLAEEPEDFAWPDVDERSAAAMCYPTVYSHRSSWLHALTVCSGNAAGVRVDDRLLPVVPMSRYSAWGLPYAALMSGADLVLPDRFLRPEPLLRLVEQARPTVCGAEPTVWHDVRSYLDDHPERDLSSLRLIVRDGSVLVPNGQDVS